MGAQDGVDGLGSTLQTATPLNSAARANGGMRWNVQSAEARVLEPAWE